MIDKLLLNNQIITNKKKIQQARIQIINKLVQKLRKLKQLNEKKPQNAKITKNLEKIPKIMVCLKKLKVSDIIRKVLTSSKKPSAILTNGQALPDEVAVALLASHKIIAAIVETLRTLLSLNDTNPGWQNEILELSKRKKKILETVDRKKNKKSKVDTKKAKVSVKKLPWKEENLEGTETDHKESNTETVPAKGWNVEPIVDNEETSVPMNKKAVKKKEDKKAKPVHSRKENDFQYDEMEVEESKPVTIVDPFFFTDSGDNYLSTVVIDRVQAEPIQDGLIRRERRDNAIRPNKRNNVFRRQSAHNGIEFENRRQSTHDDRVDKRQTKAVDEKLHPSWAAKQKLKPTITAFKGHKTTFDNDGNDASPAPKTQILKSNKNEEKLHPSWAAKQKLKPIITEFKGRKTTFDNDGTDSTPPNKTQKSNQSKSHQDKSNVASQDGIHPSWAAKQKLKPAITEFKGTKTTFDD